LNKLFSPLLIITFVLSALSHYMHWGAEIEFAFAGLAILFAAGLLGKATESVAHYAGQRLGGFLNATFGNAAELIIAIFLIKEGLFDIVKASLTGAIIGNLLLVLGASALLGGLKYKEQKFNVHLSGQNASLMLLGVIALFIPAIFVKTENISEHDTMTISIIVAAFLIIAYAGWLVYSMFTHKDLLEVMKTHRPGSRREAGMVAGKCPLPCLLLPQSWLRLSANGLYIRLIPSPRALVFPNCSSELS